jgi:hypothetical protein
MMLVFVRKRVEDLSGDGDGHGEDGGSPKKKKRQTLIQITPKHLQCHSKCRHHKPNSKITRIHEMLKPMMNIAFTPMIVTY